MNNLGAAYQVGGRNAEALELLEKVLVLRKAVLGPDHPHTFDTMANLAIAYDETGVTDKAIAIYKEVLAYRRVKLGSDHSDTIKTMNNLVAELLKAQRWADAEPLLRECLELRRKTNVDGWLRFHTMSQLGGALAGLKRFAEAEKLLLDGYKGLVEKEPKIPRCARKR